MARAETATKLPLDSWARIAGLNPLHFNGVYHPSDLPAICEQPWLQHPWQTADRVGREEVALAIALAEADIERELGYRLLPSWEFDEWRPTTRPYRPELFNLSNTDIRGFAQTVQAAWGHFITGGVRAQTLLDDDAAIVYSDEDGDTYPEVATVTVAVVVGTDPCEIHAYLPLSNPIVQAGGEEQWEIRPISVVVAGAVATIRFRREQAVLPQLQGDVLPPAGDSHQRGVDGSVDTNFLTTVDVYRVYNDPQTQATLMWEGLGNGCASCDNGCNLCQYSVQTACLTVRGDRRLSQVAYRPADWDPTALSFSPSSSCCSGQPDIVRLFYYAGLRDQRVLCPTQRMHTSWEQVVAGYATALLDRMVCACENSHSWVEYWQRDLAIAGAEESLRVPDSMLDNPFGTRRGAVFAWRRVREAALARAAVMA